MQQVTAVKKGSLEDTPPLSFYALYSRTQKAGKFELHITSASRKFQDFEEQISHISSPFLTPLKLSFLPHCKRIAIINHPSNLCLLYCLFLNLSGGFRRSLWQPSKYKILTS